MKLYGSLFCFLLITNTLPSSDSSYWPERFGDFINLTICLAPITALIGLEAGLSAIFMQAVPLEQFPQAKQRLQDYMQQAHIALDLKTIKITGISAPVACWSGILLPLEYQTALEAADTDMQSLVETIMHAVATRKKLFYTTFVYMGGVYLIQKKLWDTFLTRAKNLLIKQSSEQSRLKLYGVHALFGTVVGCLSSSISGLMSTRLILPCMEHINRWISLNRSNVASQ
jgi:hypothetical protein